MGRGGIDDYGLQAEEMGIGALVAKKPMGVMSSKDGSKRAPEGLK